MAKQVTIAIARRDGKPCTVIGTRIATYFGVHRSLDNSHTWAVTHIPTGRNVANYVERYKDAEQYARALAKVPADWTVTDLEYYRTTLPTLTLPIRP